MPDMSLIAEAIIDPEGKSAAGFFTDMAMKNILGDDLGEIMAGDNRDFRTDKMQEFVLGQMGLSDDVIPLLLSQWGFRKNLTVILKKIGHIL